MCAVGPHVPRRMAKSSYVGCAWYMAHWWYEPKVHLHLAYRYDMLVLLATKVSALLGPLCACDLLILHGSLVLFGRKCLCPRPVDAVRWLCLLHSRRRCWEQCALALNTVALLRPMCLCTWPIETVCRWGLLRRLVVLLGPLYVTVATWAGLRKMLICPI